MRSNLVKRLRIMRKKLCSARTKCRPEFFVVLAVVFATVAPSTQLAFGQPPTVLAQTVVDGLKVELYTVNNKPFGLNRYDSMFRFMDDEELNRITGPIGIEKWESSSGSRLNKDEYVLGFLIRNAKGELTNSSHLVASIYRATGEDGVAERYWPHRGQNPLSEVNKYEWDYQLAPMVLRLPKGCSRIAKLEGAIVQIPQDNTVLSLTKEDIDTSSAAYARQVAVFCVASERSSKGMGYQFLVCRSDKGKSPSSKKDSRTQPIESVELLVTGKTNYGERVRPNLHSQVGINKTMRRKLVSEIVSKTRSPDNTAIEQAMLSVVTDAKADFALLQVAFQGEQIEFDAVEIAVNVTTGLPRLLPFTINDINVPTEVDVSKVNNFVSTLKREAQAGMESPLDFRTWEDVTGKFQIEAKLLGIEAEKVQLQKKDGSIVSVPLDKLSESDRAYLSTAR